MITWNGIGSDQFGVLVERYPTYTRPARKINTYSVPGRNGDIIMAQDAWEPVIQQYDLVVGDGEEHSAVDVFNQVSEWLMGPTGYCELSDDFDPTHYRLAYVSDQFTLEPIARAEAGRVIVPFVCKPQRFLVSGKTPITLTSSGTINNPTAYKARPLIFVAKGSTSTGSLVIGTTVFTLLSIPATGVYIDCDEMECYGENGANLNSVVTSSTSEFAVLNPGNNAVAFAGGVASVNITPRWFEI